MRMRNVKRWLASLLCAGLLCQMTVLPAFAEAGIEETLANGTATTAEELETENGWSLADLKSQFPEGRYWNHMDNPGASNNDPMHTSSTPCTSHGSKGYNSSTCNHFGSGYYCCWGYADQVGYLYSGSNPEKWTKLEGTSAINYLDNLKTGDIVRFRFNSGAEHSMFVTSVTSSRVYYTDCNVDGKCGISWSHSQTRAYFKENSRTLWVRVCPVGESETPAPTPDPNVDSLGCTTKYAGWYVVGSTAANINSGHNKNWNSSIGETFHANGLIYVTKATGVGSGNLGHVNYGGQERYVAMGMLASKYTGLIGNGNSKKEVDWATGQYNIEGYAWDWDNTNAQVKIELYLDSQLSAVTYANQYEDYPRRFYYALTDEGNPGYYHGFSIPIQVKDPGTHTVRTVAYSADGQTSKEIGSLTIETPAVTNLEVATMPNKVDYKVGEAFDATGLVLRATRYGIWAGTSTSQRTEFVTTGYTYTPEKFTTAGDQTVTATYYGQSTSFTVHVKANDVEAPVISNVQVTNVTTEGYDVSCTVTDNVGVNRVQFPTWTDANGQDDLLSDWSINPKASGTRNGDTWTFHVSIADHNNERGKYITHIYAYDDAGNIQSNVNVASGVEVPVPNPTLTFDANGGTAEFDTKQAERGAAYGALPEAWMDGYVFDGWYTDAVGGSRVSSSTVYTAAGHTTLYAHWMPVASDAEQGWSLQDGTLIITSQGAMQDYTSARETPWFSDRADIRKIVVQNGVTSIGNYAFYGCENVTSVALPSTVTQIGKLAFYGCRNLSSLTLPDSLTMVEDYAFAKASGLGTIAFKGSAPLFGAGVFADVSAEVRYPAEDSTWTDAVRQSYTGNVSWAGVSEAELTVQTSDLQLNDPELEALLADSCV